VSKNAPFSRYDDISVENRRKNQPTLIWHVPLRWPLRIFGRLIYCQKLESWGYQTVYIFHHLAFALLGTIPACDRRDGVENVAERAEMSSGVQRWAEVRKNERSTDQERSGHTGQRAESESAAHGRSSLLSTVQSALCSLHYRRYTGWSKKTRPFYIFPNI